MIDLVAFCHEPEILSAHGFQSVEAATVLVLAEPFHCVVVMIAPAQSGAGRGSLGAHARAATPRIRRSDRARSDRGYR